MKIYKENYIFCIDDINYLSQYNFKNIFQLYYHNNINYCDNIEYINILELFTKDDFISLSYNRITQNILYLLNKICTVNLYKLLCNGYKYFDKDMLYDLFVPFSIIKVYKNKKLIKSNIIEPDLFFFENIIDLTKFNSDFYDYKYVMHK
ncbi:unknown similar to AMEV102 [Adoxophyes honmai entomopoxvirus 'L']|uniref:Uncharacterized protein n=1 Tax=Adoxophyes honmai entomopoxvirus 'L' TaxID=1293540 RepID=A0A916KP43_9POXV|nr:unknown similar to AMEV102 [Adoxophyes honmai entomopoxvirus 'L']CCU55429.1 unknown similar to AMEV102 [Adoxophyes honmai entomopoxvirus 'L']